MYQDSLNFGWGAMVFAMFVLFTSTALILGSIPDWWPWAKNKLYSFWKSLWDFGFEDSSPYDRYGQYVDRGNQSSKPQPHIHSWVYYTTTKHNWRIVNGKPAGMWSPIDRVIQEVRMRPSHTETKLETLLRWKSSGYNIVHTSWNHWKCKVSGCNETQATEYYTAPAKADGTAYILTSKDLSGTYAYDTSNNTENRFKKTTSRITTWRREIPVEKMKKYGVTI